MPKLYVNVCIVLAFVAGYALTVTGLFNLFGSWSLVGAGIPLVLLILLLDTEETDNG